VSEHSFHQQSYASRNKTMGATAETAFLGRFPNAHRMGIDRPSFSVMKLAPNYRHTPDFLLGDAAYEVMGVSTRTKNATLKMKIEKLDSLGAWELLGPVKLWVWDSYRKVAWHAPIAVWRDTMHNLAEIDRFPDNNKPYWKLLVTDFPVDPT